MKINKLLVCLASSMLLLSLSGCNSTPSNVTFNDCFGGEVTNYKDYSAKSTPNEYAESRQYVFDGWYTEPNGLGEKMTSPKEGTQYYAKWIRDEKTVLTQGFDFTDTDTVVPDNCGVYWFQENNILTLDGATFDGSKNYVDGDTFIFKLPADTQVVVTSNESNLYGSNSDNGNAYGLISNGNLKISGNSSLNIYAGDADKNFFDCSYGIWASSLINNAKVCAEGGTGFFVSAGVYAEKEIKNYSTLNGYGSDAYDYSCGVFCGENDNGNASTDSSVIFNCGNLTAMSTSSNSIVSSGILVKNRLINNNTVYATSACGTYSYGIYCPGTEDEDGDVEYGTGIIDNNNEIYARSSAGCQSYGIWCGDALNNNFMASIDTGSGSASSDINSDFSDDIVSAGIDANELINKGTVSSFSSDSDNASLGILCSYLDNDGKLTSQSGNGKLYSIGINSAHSIYNDSDGEITAYGHDAEEGSFGVRTGANLINYGTITAEGGKTPDDMLNEAIGAEKYISVLRDAKITANGTIAAENGFSSNLLVEDGNSKYKVNKDEKIITPKNDTVDVYSYKEINTINITNLPMYATLDSEGKYYLCDEAGNQVHFEVSEEDSEKYDIIGAYGGPKNDGQGDGYIIILRPKAGYVFANNFTFSDSRVVSCALDDNGKNTPVDEDMMEDVKNANTDEVQVGDVVLEWDLTILR